MSAAERSLHVARNLLRRARIRLVDEPGNAALDAEIVSFLANKVSREDKEAEPSLYSAEPWIAWRGSAPDFARDMRSVIAPEKLTEIVSVLATQANFPAIVAMLVRQTDSAAVSREECRATVLAYFAPEDLAWVASIVDVALEDARMQTGVDEQCPRSPKKRCEMFEAWQNENCVWLVRFGAFKIDVVMGGRAGFSLAFALANALNAEPMARKLARKLDSEDWTVPGSRSWSDLWGYDHEVEALREAGEPLSGIQQAASDLSTIVTRLRQNEPYR